MNVRVARFRVFTTAAFCIATGARAIVLVADDEHRGGRVADVEAGDRAAVERLDPTGRRVVQRTSAGTQGVNAASRARGIVLGSFVIAEATVRYVRRSAD